MSGSSGAVPVGTIAKWSETPLLSSTLSRFFGPSASTRWASGPIAALSSGSSMAPRASSTWSTLLRSPASFAQASSSGVGGRSPRIVQACSIVGGAMIPPCDELSANPRSR